jgi:hypothetical protein
MGVWKIKLILGVRTQQEPGRLRYEWKEDDNEHHHRKEKSNS